MTDNWLSNYYNKRKETAIHSRETYYIIDTNNNNTAYSEAEDKQLDPTGSLKGRQSKFWTLSAYHRVFGLYIKRRISQKTDECELIAIVQSDKRLLKNFNIGFAIYWPVANYPGRMTTKFLNDSDNLEFTRYMDGNYGGGVGQPSNCWFYQSITSTLVMGKVRGNPADSQLFDSEHTSRQMFAESKDEWRPEFVEQQYFRRSARKQLGEHVFCSAYGNLMHLRVYFYANPDYRPNDNHQTKHVFQVIPKASLTAIYPTIRNEWYKDLNGQWTETNPQHMTRQVFAMGLAYRRFGRNNESVVCYGRIGTNPELTLVKELNGWSYDTDYLNQPKDGRLDHRIYTRFKDELQLNNCGGVYDLTEQQFNEIDYKYGGNSGSISNQPRFALYLCAGAKLVVLDSYNKQISNHQHNRSLFEQGSVVIVEDQLYMTIPYDQWYKKAERLKDRRQLMDWKMFCQTFIKDESIKQKVMDYENPVVFLGAHESDYNTSAWGLVIEKLATEKVTDFDRSQQRFQVTYGRQCVLEVPEGGYIVAVEEWRDGMDEIWYRHQYEQLHRAIVKHQTPQSIRYINPQDFQLPPQVGDWLNKIILNTSAKHPAGRQLPIKIYTNEISEAYKQLYKKYLKKPNMEPRDHIVWPKEFNFRQFVGQHVDSQLANSYCKSASPAYPPVKITDLDGSHRLFYLPQKLLIDAQLDSGTERIKCNLLTVFKKYEIDRQTYSTVGGKTHINTNNPKVILKLIQTKAEFNEYEWKWLDNPFVDKHQLMNREDYRLGVDGHYYRKWSPANNPQHIGKVLSVYYEFTEFGTDRPIQVNIQSESGNFLPQTNPFRWRKDNELVRLFQKRPYL